MTDSTELNDEQKRVVAFYDRHLNRRPAAAAGDCGVGAGEHSMADIEITDEDYKKVDNNLPDNNPKTRAGALKAPLHLVPPSAEFYLALALKDGAEKYGPYNWREEPISMSVYIGAIKRHLGAFQDGEDYAADSGVRHLAHIMACCALMLDAEPLGQLKDDRATSGAQPVLLNAYNQGRVDL